MRTRIALNTALTATLVAGTVLFGPDRAHAAGPVYSGNGWKINALRITHIDTKPWTVAFHDTTSRTKLTGYAKNAAAELTSHLGVKITVTTRIVPTKVGVCPPSHTISIRWISKPNPDRPNQSFTGSCGHQQAAYSAYVYINSDYWAPGRRFTEWQRMNVFWHEMAHAVGLGHPATCPRDRSGRQPLMCGNPYTDLRTRRYSSFEHTAFKHLVTNRLYAPLS